MTLLDAIILGIIQGFTEFLPVSSSGHLAIAGFLGITGSEGTIAFFIILHCGTLAAVICAMRSEITEILTTKRSLIPLILLTTLVTGIIGLTLKKVIEKSFEKVIIVSIGFIITAILIAAGEFVYRKMTGKKDRITLWRSAIVGFFQGIAAFPGISRSGATISAGFFTGLDRETAVRYSFLVSILAIPGAFIMELKHIAAIEGFFIPAAGFAAAFVSGFAALKALLRIIKTRYYILFAVYTLILGLVLICRELNGH